MTAAAKYRSLHNYLNGRYANMVVLTFQQIEDLLGFALPVEARTDPSWWTESPERAWSDVWTLAKRIPKPNLTAGHVVFERLV